MRDTETESLDGHLAPIWNALTLFGESREFVNDLRPLSRGASIPSGVSSRLPPIPLEDSQTSAGLILRNA